MNRLLLVAAVALAPIASGQKLLDKTKPATDPVNDPYTRGGDPAIMEAVGYASMGGFEFGPEPDTSESITKFLGYADIRWVETKHFELGIALPKIKVKQDERDKIRAELTELKVHMPDIDERTRVMDPWIRVHLYAKRIEEAYVDVMNLMGVTDEDFADCTPVWNMKGKFMGSGPYLGQRGKYEMLILPSEGMATDFLKNKIGLTTKKTQRWNFVERGTLAVIAHTDQGGLKIDEALHGHVASHVAHLMINGYKNYSYDMPVWVHEGVAHWIERRINPRFNTFSAAEGAAGAMTRKWNWAAETKKLVKSDKAPSFASLISLRTFSELELADHYATWSVVDYLMTVHPKFLAVYFDRTAGLLGADSIPDGTELPNVQRDVFKEELGMTYRQFETAWKAWVEETY